VPVLGIDLREEEHMGMAHDEPLAAVIAELTAPSDFELPAAQVFGDKDQVPRATITSHGPFARDPTSIEVQKQRESDNRRLYAVSFDDLKGNRWFWLVATELGADGWSAHGVAGGSDGPVSRKRETSRPSPAGSAPSLNLCGRWGGDTFYAGGQLDSAGAEIGRVQLTLEDGSQLEDDGVGAVSLFIGHHGEPPTSVEIFAPDGALLSKRKAF
jgi:hypothetical protein